MRKRKVKLTLIQDYIELAEVRSLCAYGTQYAGSVWLQNLTSRCEQLQNCYQQILLMIGCWDLSFAVLRDNLAFDWAEFFRWHADQPGVLRRKLAAAAENLCRLENELGTKLKRLSLNNFEIYALKSFA